MPIHSLSSAIDGATPLVLAGSGWIAGRSSWDWVLLALLAVAIYGFVRERRRWSRVNSTLEQQVSVRTRELELLNAQLKERTLRDDLTGLRNRRFVEGVIHHDLARVARDCRDYGSSPFSLVFFLVDLDHFKQVNDSYGHTVGDRVLMETALLLRQVFRESDYVIRWGGDEFLAVVRYIAASEAPLLAERVRRRVHEHAFNLGANPERGEITASVGYVVHPLMPSVPEALDLNSILHVADVCLYAAKRSGRNGWVGLGGLGDEADEALVHGLIDDPGSVVTGGLIDLESSFERVDLQVARTGE